jgi:hypothetical protein
VKDIEDAITTNSIWKITKRFTRQQTQRHHPSNSRRWGLTYTRQDKATAIAGVYEDQFRSNSEDQVSATSLDR